MTRDEAVKIWLEFGSHRVHAYHVRRSPKHIADGMMAINAEDCIDGLIALGLLQVDMPSPAPDGVVSSPKERTDG